MTKDHPILAFIVDSPLQSWGHASRFQRRMPLAHPTRSGVIALLAATFGIAKSAVTLKSGESARQKMLHLAGDAATLAAKAKNLFQSDA